MIIDDGGTYICVTIGNGDSVIIAAYELDRLETEVEEHCKTGKDKLLCLELAYGGQYYIKVSIISDFGITTPETREAHWIQTEAVKRCRKALYPD